MISINSEYLEVYKIRLGKIIIDKIPSTLENDLAILCINDKLKLIIAKDALAPLVKIINKYLNKEIKND